MSAIKKGFFVVLDGMDGTGKTTQVRNLAKRFQKCDYNVVTTRDPGGSPGAEEIRSLLLNGDVEKWDGVSEVLLFGAARRSHSEYTIKPALAAGKLILCDRFLPSTIAYQGFGQQRPLALIEEVSKWVLEDLKPDLTLIFFIDPEFSMKRAKARGELNRMEKYKSDFYQRVGDGYRYAYEQGKKTDSVDDPSYHAITVEEDAILSVEDQIAQLNDRLYAIITNALARRRPWLAGHNEIQPIV